MIDPASPTAPLDALLLPGHHGLDVFAALARAASLCHEMHESKSLCSHVLERLLFLRNKLQLQHTRSNTSTIKHARAVAQFPNTIGLVFCFLNKYAQLSFLQRVTTSRALREEVRSLHSEIDKLFNDAGLSGTPEMTKWKQLEISDIRAQQTQLEDFVQNHNDHASDLTGRSLEEALAEIKVEIDSEPNPGSVTALQKRVLDGIVGDTKIPNIPIWFICRSGIDVGEQIGMGSFGTVNQGKWGSKVTNVCVKMLLVDDALEAQSFEYELALCSQMSHPFVLKTFGGCHLGKPLFSVVELAKQGNFMDFLHREKTNMRSFWKLFYQAALGLSYLHSKRIVHSDIKCSNLLVGDDGTAKICDFRFSHDARVSNFAQAIVEQPSSVRWRAPECLFRQGADANTTFKSDVYSLGMSIIEARSGVVPWGAKSESAILDEVATGASYPRPDEFFTNAEWGIVQALTKFDPNDRVTLKEVIKMLEQLAEAEELATANELQSVTCGECGDAFPLSGNFCGSCGADKPSKQQLSASAASSLPHSQLDHGAKMADTTADGAYGDERSNSRNRIIGQDSNNPEALVPDNPAQQSSRIKLLEKLLSIMRYLGYEKPSGRFCSSCGDLNPSESVFCCECGNDIEVVRGKKL